VKNSPPSPRKFGEEYDNREHAKRLVKLPDWRTGPQYEVQDDREDRSDEDQDRGYTSPGQSSVAGSMPEDTPTRDVKLTQETQASCRTANEVSAGNQPDSAASHNNGLENSHHEHSDIRNPAPGSSTAVSAKCKLSQRSPQPDKAESLKRQSKVAGSHGSHNR
jgi:hypothetical protein